MNTVKEVVIEVARAGLLSDKQKRAFVGCAGIVTDVGFLDFKGWEDRCLREFETASGVWYTSAVFTTRNTEMPTRDTEQWLRGVAYAVTQIVPNDGAQG